MTRTVIVVVALFVLAAVASANPVAYDAIYVSFDPDDIMPEIPPPAPGAVMCAYVWVELMDQGYLGFTTVAFRMGNTPGLDIVPMGFIPEPGFAVTGDWTSGYYVTTPCRDDFPVVVGCAQFQYVSGTGAITLSQHPVHGPFMYDCESTPGIVAYCVWWHGSIGVDQMMGDCGGNPVEDFSWTAIKGLYR